MRPERWRRIEELYHGAEALPPGERTAFLQGACPDDDAVRRDVESLLNESASSDGLLDKHALVAGAELEVEDVAPGSMAGRSIGTYQLQALIGAGGMGEVYRARDTSLGRDVAIKILPAALMNDADRLARLEREARVLASLNHPGICAIYGIDEADGIRLLVLELVEGETLADRLAARRESGKRGLAISDALSIARQISDALEDAHDKGIVHRDLKPANVKITHDGLVKILDFGLAKAVGGANSAPDLTLAPAPAATGEHAGIVMGTAAYMSPEQARGLAVDKRTDIWAFGCVLFEMLTGHMAFAGDTVSDSIARILEREPAWSMLPPAIPVSIRRLLFRALTKDPRKRLRDIGDARVEIDAIDEAVPGVADRPVAPAADAARWLRWGVVAALIIGLIAIAAWTFRPLPAAAVTRFTHTLPAGQILNGSRGAHIVAVSPDGSRFVYSGTPHGLYMRSMSDLDARLIPGTGSYEASEPVFSPDGRSIVFFTIAEQALAKVNVTGGAAQILAPVDVTPTGIAWGEGGIVFGQGSHGVMRIAPEGGTPELLVRMKAGETVYNPQVLPGGTQMLFTVAQGAAPSRWDRAQIFVESLASHRRTLLLDGGSDARYLPTGHLIYAHAGSVYAAAIDLKALKVTSERVAVLEGVRRAAGNFTGAAIFSLSTRGTLAYVPGPLAGEGSAPLDLALIDRHGEVEPLHLPPGPYSRPRVSPDGQRVLFESDDGKEAVVYTYELSGASTMQRVTTGGNNRFPIWASNTRVAFQSDREGDRAVWWQPFDGPASRLTRPEPGASHEPESWIGDTLLYSVTRDGDVSLWTLSVQSGKSTRFGTIASSAPTGAAISPDGRWVAYTTTTQNETTLYVQGFPTGMPYALTAGPADTPKHPRWSWNGKELCYNPRVSAFECVRVIPEPFAFGNAVAVPKKMQTGPPGSRTNYDVTRDGRLIGLVTSGQKAFVRGSDTQINIVLNWFDELEARVPRR